MAIGRRYADADLLAFTGMASGQTLMFLGRAAEGLALLDEAMVSVTAGEVSAVTAGIVYCALIEACHAIFDLRRAGEWTEALSGWCAAQPDLVPYRGNCLVHRAEVLLLRGLWDHAGGEAAEAEQRLAGTPAAADAHYQRGEVHRLKGEMAEAEAAYRLASDLGKSPQPGLCLLRLAQGQIGPAAAGIRRLLDETTEPPFRARLLGAAVENLLADGDVAGARAAADELSGHAAAFDAPLLYATAGYAAGSVLLAEANPKGACETLRRAAGLWRDLDVPYEVARCRALLGVACGQLGDTDGAAMELDAARRSFTALGAEPALRLLGGAAAAAAADEGELKGRDEVVRYLGAFLDALPDFRWESLAEHESGDTSIDEGWVIGTNTGDIHLPTGDVVPATGKAVRIRGCDVATVQDGLIVCHNFYFDQMELLGQLGLLPEQG